MVVLDASAVLAYLQRERGGETVREAIEDSVMSTANWSEVLQKSLQHGRDPAQVGGLLRMRGIGAEPVTIEDAEAAAGLWRRHPTLSLADRLCLALAGRLGCEVLTTDGAWDGVPGAHVIR